MNIKDFFKKLIRKKRYGNVIIVDSNSAAIAQNDTLTIVKKADIFTWVKFKCPCGCGEEIMLSLNPQIKPCWSLKVKDINGKYVATLSPSINLTGYQCKSHFFIRDNKVIWVQPKPKNL